MALFRYVTVSLFAKAGKCSWDSRGPSADDLLKTVGPLRPSTLFNASA